MAPALFPDSMYSSSGVLSYTTRHVASAGPVAIPRAKQIVLEGPQGKVVLRNLKPDEKPAADQTAASVDATQLAEQWEIVEPVHDRPEPERRYRAAARGRPPARTRA